jgi:hypothetical protein
VKPRSLQNKDDIATMLPLTGFYNEYYSIKDVNGIYTVIDYKRADGTLYLKSTLSNPDPTANYQTDTWKFYDSTGSAVIQTITWAITYDSTNVVTSRVMQ